MKRLLSMNFILIIYVIKGGIRMNNPLRKAEINNTKCLYDCI